MNQHIYFFVFTWEHLPDHLRADWRKILYPFGQKEKDDFYIEYDDEFSKLLDIYVDGIIEYVYPKLFKN